jgi:hypothetical protein
MSSNMMKSNGIDLLNPDSIGDLVLITRLSLMFNNILFNVLFVLVDRPC